MFLYVHAALFGVGLCQAQRITYLPCSPIVSVQLEHELRCMQSECVPDCIRSIQALCKLHALLNVRDSVVIVNA